MRCDTGKTIKPRVILKLYLPIVLAIIDMTWYINVSRCMNYLKGSFLGLLLFIFLLLFGKSTSRECV